MKDWADFFHKHIMVMFERIHVEQETKIVNVGDAMAECIISGGNVFIFGPGHAGMLAEEFFYRAGGLAVINPLFNPCLAPTIRPITVSTDVEHMEGFAEIVLKNSPIKKGDFLLIHSVAARNPIVVEMAEIALSRGIRVGAIINSVFAHSAGPLKPGGKMLYDVVPEELTIDNCGDDGDASVDIGLDYKAVSTSSITGTYIVAQLVLEICGMLTQKGMTPPLFASANADGGAEYNEKLLEKYKDHIFYM